MPVVGCVLSHVVRDEGEHTPLSSWLFRFANFSEKDAKKLSSCFSMSKCIPALDCNVKITVLVPSLRFARDIWIPDYSGCKNYHLRFGSLALSASCHPVFTFHPPRASLWHSFTSSTVDILWTLACVGVHKPAAKLELLT